MIGEVFSCHKNLEQLGDCGDQSRGNSEDCNSIEKDVDWSDELETQGEELVAQQISDDSYGPSDGDSTELIPANGLVLDWGDMYAQQSKPRIAGRAQE